MCKRRSPDQIHNIVEFMRWRNLRLIVDRAPAPLKDLQVIAVPLTENAPRSYPNHAAGHAHQRRQDLRLGRERDFPAVSLSGHKPCWSGGPDNLHGDHRSVLPLRGSGRRHRAQRIGSGRQVWPVLTVSVVSSDPVGFPPLSFAADLKLVLAPRLSRPDQHRPAQFPNTFRRDTNVVSVFSDTNTLTRGIPGQFVLLGPNKPFWDRVFDYAEPDLHSEMEFDAVVFPRSLASTNPFIVASPATTLLQCQRVGGQGEFDNVHIHPWVGLDDPSSGGGTNPTSPALVEAPLAADEVIHMHWRWGVGIPQGCETH
jgi:hypothetical protein